MEVKMKLRNKKEKIEFLKKCYSHINRILSDLGHELKEEYHPKIKISIPARIDCEKVFGIDTYGTLKIEILIDLYNCVAQEVNKSQSTNLEPLFNREKEKISNVLREEMSEYAGQSVENIMRKQRNKTGIPILDWLLSFIPPSSASFLDSYGFFDKKSNSRSEDSSIPQPVNPRDI